MPRCDDPRFAAVVNFARSADRARPSRPAIPAGDEPLAEPVSRSDKRAGPSRRFSAWCEPNFGDRMMLGLGDMQRPGGELDAFTGFLGDPTEGGQGESGDGDVVTSRGVVDGDTDVRQVVDGKRPGQGEGSVGPGRDRQHFEVGFVVDLADHLLEQVLDGDDAVDRAVLVDDDGELLSFRPEPPQGVGDPHAIRHHHRCTGGVRCRPVLAEQVNDTDHVVESM